MPESALQSDKQIVFLVSLPRSGSTLLQRLLAAHPAISTVPEPWLLLPLIYALRSEGVWAEYGHATSSLAMKDFCERLPRATETYLHSVSKIAAELYSLAAAPDCRFFLDKTPRNTLILQEIIAAFPDAKFIFLWRNPLGVIASLMETFRSGRWNIYASRIDLYAGLEGMIEGWSICKSRAISLKFEDMLRSPREELTKVFDYLALDFDPSLLDRLNEVQLTGVVGDPTGAGRYRAVDPEPITKWRKTLRNPFRRLWCRRYIKWIGSDRLRLMGYDLEALLHELNANEMRFNHLLSDIGRSCYGWLDHRLEVGLLRRKFQHPRNRRYRHR